MLQNIWPVVADNGSLLGKARRLMYVCSFSKTAVSFFISFWSSTFLALNAAVQREDSHSSSKLGTYEFMHLKVSIWIFVFCYMIFRKDEKNILGHFPKHMEKQCQRRVLRIGRYYERKKMLVINC